LLVNLLHGQDDDAAAAKHFAIAYQATNDPDYGNNLASALERLDRVPEANDLGGSSPIANWPGIPLVAC